MIILRKHITLEQREYGLISKIRNKLADKIENISNNTSSKIRKKVFEYNKTRKPIDDVDLRNKVLRNEASKSNTIITHKNPRLDEGKGNYFPINTENKERLKNLLKDSNSRISLDDKKVISKAVFRNKEGIIAVNPKAGVDTLSHELGHKRNSRNNNTRIKENHKQAKKGFPKNEYIPGESSLKEAWGDFKNNYNQIKSVLKEERRADKEGKNILKKANANKNQLKQYKKNRQNDYNTYKSDAIKSTGKDISRLIRPAQNRGRRRYDKT